MKKALIIIFMALLIGITNCNSDNAITSENTPENNAKQISSTNRVVDTGQNLSYDNDGNVIEPQPGEPFYGQDAQYTGTKFSFAESDDGATITDLNTGLIWQRSPTEEKFIWEDAQAYCENLDYAGHNDWRLPNVKELQSIVDYSGVYPAIDPDYFNISDDNAYFWSSTSAYFSKVSEETAKQYWAWYVAFGYAVGENGEDLHGAGAVRFDTKVEGGSKGEDAERIYNYARAVRDIGK